MKKGDNYMGLFFNKYKFQEYGRLAKSEEQQHREKIFKCTKKLCDGNLYIDENNGLFYIESSQGYQRTTIAKTQNITGIHSDLVYDIGDDGPSSINQGRIIFDLKDEEFLYIDYKFSIDRKMFNFNAKRQYEKVSRSSMDEVCAYFNIKEGKISKTTD